MEPTTFDNGASAALGAIFESRLDSFGTTNATLDGLAEMLETFIVEGFGASDLPAEEVLASWVSIGALAVELAESLLGEPLSHAECRDLLVRKQHDYGPSNILRFSAPGMPGGLLVRCWDKVARLQNLTQRGVDPANESLRDSFLDLANYAAIGIMVETGSFTLPLARD